MADIHIEFGAEVQIFDILQDDIALHGQDAVEDIFDHLESIVAFAEEGGDVSSVDNRVVGDIEELGAAVEGEGVDFGNDGLNIGDELEDPLGGIRPQDSWVAFDDYLEVLVDREVGVLHVLHEFFDVLAHLYNL